MASKDYHENYSGKVRQVEQEAGHRSLSIYNPIVRSKIAGGLLAIIGPFLLASGCASPYQARKTPTVSTPTPIERHAVPAVAGRYGSAPAPYIPPRAPETTVKVRGKGFVKVPGETPAQSHSPTPEQLALIRKSLTDSNLVSRASAAELPPAESGQPYDGKRLAVAPRVDDSGKVDGVYAALIMPFGKGVKEIALSGYRSSDYKGKSVGVKILKGAWGGLKALLVALLARSLGGGGGGGKNRSSESESGSYSSFGQSGGKPAPAPAPSGSYGGGTGNPIGKKAGKK